MARLEEALRHDLNESASRVMAVLEPLKVVIENFPADQVEPRLAANHPAKPELGNREISFSREIFIERSDFMENAPKSFFRLQPGGEVRLRFAYVIKCHEVKKDPATGEILELRCTYDPETAGGKTPDGRKIKGTIHWVSATNAVEAEVRLYENLLLVESLSEVEEGADWKAQLNPHSLRVLRGCKLEASLQNAAVGQSFQFERNGYFCLDSEDSRPDSLVFNRSVSLREASDKST